MNTELKDWLAIIADREQLKKDLAKLATFSETDLVDVCALIASGNTFGDTGMHKAIKEKGLEESSLQDALHAVLWIFLNLPDGIRLDEAIDALADPGVLDSKTNERIAGSLRSIDQQTKFCETIQLAADDESALSITFPRLKTAWTRCVGITCFVPEYNSARDEPNTYTPEIRGFTTVTVVQMELDEFRTKKTVAFAVREKELKQFISQLKLAHKQMRLTRDRLAGGQSQPENMKTDSANVIPGNPEAV